MIISAPLGEQTLPQDIIKSDRKECRKIGPCGIGRQALYVGSRFVSRYYYIPWTSVRRVFKRVAMSRGGYSGKGVFGSMAYLVVQYGNGKEKSCYFKHENELDVLLAEVERSYPQIPTHSEKADRKLSEAADRERDRYAKKLTPEAEETLEYLGQARKYLAKRPALADGLTSAARQKRIVDHLKPSVLAAGTVVGVLGLAAALAGISMLLFHHSEGMYFLLGGGAFFFFVFSANLFPSKWNSKKYAAEQWSEAVENSQTYIRAYADKSFPVPAQYAHPVILDRMIRIVREGRADSAEEALEMVKEDLKKLNAGVTVSQQEHDEVVEIKPLFLVSDYQ